jgi:hypothetical protein
VTPVQRSGEQERAEAVTQVLRARDVRSAPLPESWQQFNSAAQHVADMFPSSQYVPAKPGGKSYTSSTLGLG